MKSQYPENMMQYAKSFGMKLPQGAKNIKKNADFVSAYIENECTFTKSEKTAIIGYFLQGKTQKMIAEEEGKSRQRINQYIRNGVEKVFRSKDMFDWEDNETEHKPTLTEIGLSTRSINRLGRAILLKKSNPGINLRWPYRIEDAKKLVDDFGVTIKDVEKVWGVGPKTIEEIRRLCPWIPDPDEWW